MYNILKLTTESIIQPHTNWPHKWAIVALHYWAYNYILQLLYLHLYINKI